MFVVLILTVIYWLCVEYTLMLLEKVQDKQEELFDMVKKKDNKQC